MGFDGLSLDLAYSQACSSSSRASTHSSRHSSTLSQEPSGELGTTPRRSSRGVVRAFRCALQSLCGTRRLWGLISRRRSIVVVELALAGGAEFLYHLFEFGDLFERARTEFELVCRISTFARREDSSFRRWFAADRRSRSFGLPRFEVLVAQAVEQAKGRVGGSRRGTRSCLSRRRGAARADLPKDRRVFNRVDMVIEEVILDERSEIGVRLVGGRFYPRMSSTSTSRSSAYSSYASSNRSTMRSRMSTCSSVPSSGMIPIPRGQPPMAKWWTRSLTCLSMFSGTSGRSQGRELREFRQTRMS